MQSQIWHWRGIFFGTSPRWDPQSYSDSFFDRGAFQCNGDSSPSAALRLCSSCGTKAAAAAEDGS